MPEFWFGLNAVYSTWTPSCTHLPPPPLLKVNVSLAQGISGCFSPGWAHFQSVQQWDLLKAAGFHLWGGRPVTVTAGLPVTRPQDGTLLDYNDARWAVCTLEPVAYIICWVCTVPCTITKAALVVNEVRFLCKHRQTFLFFSAPTYLNVCQICILCG